METQELEKVFARKLSKAGWHTYRDEESGRVVTNAYASEREKLERISGMACEVITEPAAEGTCARIGPTLPGNSTRTTDG